MARTATKTATATKTKRSSVPPSPQSSARGAALLAKATAALKHPTPQIKPEWADLLRPLTDTERDALAESIDQEGVLQPILVDEEGYIIDGMHRFEIAGKGCPVRMIEGLDAARLAALVVALNKARRQMDAAAIKEADAALVEYMRQLHDEGESTREIAQATGTTQSKAARVTKGRAPARTSPAQKAAAKRRKASTNGATPANTGASYKIVRASLGGVLRHLGNPLEDYKAKERRELREVAEKIVTALAD